MVKLNRIEQSSINTVMTKGLERAAKQLSFFMKEEIAALTPLVFDIFSPSKNILDTYIHQSSNIHVLDSKIIGDIQGVSSLILSEKDADTLRTKALPPSLKKDSPSYIAMKDSILLEIDNILTASVVTEITNQLSGKTIYGDIPHLFIIDRKELTQHIIRYKNEHQYIIHIKTNFISATTAFTPVFMWYFDQQFLNHIQQLYT